MTPSDAEAESVQPRRVAVPNPDETYWIKDSHGQRPMVPTDFATDAFQKTIKSTKTPMIFWRPGLLAWTNDPNELLGYWVRRVGDIGAGLWKCTADADQLRGAGYEAWWPEAWQWSLLPQWQAESLAAPPHVSPFTLPLRAEWSEVWPSDATTGWVGEVVSAVADLAQQRGLSDLIHGIAKPPESGMPWDWRRVTGKMPFVVRTSNSHRFEMSDLLFGFRAWDGLIELYGVPSSVEIGRRAVWRLTEIRGNPRRRWSWLEGPLDTDCRTYLTGGASSLVGQLQRYEDLGIRLISERHWREDGPRIVENLSRHSALRAPPP